MDCFRPADIESRIFDRDFIEKCCSSKIPELFRNWGYEQSSENFL